MRLGDKAKQEHSGPIYTTSQHGIYTVTLPLSSGKEAVFLVYALKRLQVNFQRTHLKQSKET